MKKTKWMLSRLVLSSAAAFGLTSDFVSQTFANHENEKFVPGEMIVKVKEQKKFSVLEKKEIIQRALFQTLGNQSILSISSLQMDSGIQKVRIKKDENILTAIKLLKENPEIEYAEPNYIYHAFNLDPVNENAALDPNDSDFSKQWDMKNTGQTDKAGQVGTPGADINVSPVWAKGITGSKKVLVAVIDTGVDYTHPDLVDNVYTNPGESGSLSTNGKDDDGNGIIDDLHGASFVDSTTGNIAGTNKSLDDHSHGTHCAGTIGAKGNNNLGLTGVNWNVSILPVKFLSATGSGSLEGALNAIKYATKMKVDIMSNSWGGGGFSQALLDAIKEADNAGILFVAAAGNDGSENDSTPSYPASYDVANVLSVAATDNRDQIASFSNYGVKTVHVAAPGDQILSTVLNGGYNTYRGTSMACPHVAGMAALLLSHQPRLTALQLKQRLIETSTPIKNLKKKVMARGRVNMENAINNFIPPSSEPDESLWVDEAYSFESAHPYKSNANEEKEISISGAKYIRVVFEKIELEQKYDTLKVINAAGELVDELTGESQNTVTEYVEGDKLLLKLSTDTSVEKWGFKISKIQVIR